MGIRSPSSSTSYLWYFPGASAFLTTVEGATPFPSTLKVFRAARIRIDNGAVVVGAESALVFSATCNRSVVAASQYQPQIVVDISGHSFSSIIFNASNDPLCDSDVVSTDKTTLAVLGIASLDASSLTASPSNGALQILAIGYMGTTTLSFDKSYFIDYFRLSTSAFFTNTLLSLGNSALSVDTESPSWLCGSSFVCRNMSLRSCGIHVSLLNLSNLGSEWLALDLRGSNDFEKVTQPSGLQSTEPVLLDAESCDVTNPCYEGGYARCVCSGSSSSSSDSEPSSPSPPSSPIWERRDVWIAVSAVLAFIMLFVGIMYLCKGWCVGDGRHSSYMNIDQRDMRGAEELNERDAYGGGSHTQWSQEDEAAILCDAQECLFMFDQYIIYPHALGDGTTAKVFKVTRKADRQTLAMKRYSFKATNNDDDFADFAAFEWMELFKEFWLLRHIDHPNVIRIEEVFISFYDALAAHSGNSDTAVLGSFSSNPLSSSSSVTIQLSGKQRFSDTHYPPESLTDNLTPFLLAVDKVRSHVVPNRALEQQNRSRRYCYIFMSYIPDGTLVTFLNQRRGEEARSASNRAVVDNRAVLCEEEALALALQLFQALEYLHDPHRRRHLWAIANGGGNSMSEVTETSSRFFSKPSALSSLSHSDNHMFSSASFAKSLREGGAAGPAAASRGTSQLLMEDGPILHRDVKPDNLLIHRLPGYHVGPFTQRRYPNARLVLTDFGFADFYRQGVHVSHKGAPPAYAAPEVVRGRPSPACDIFSAGVVLFEMLSTSKVDQRHHGHFSTGVSRPSYVEKQKGLLFSLGIREETISFLFRRILVYDPAERCSAAQAVQELRLLLAPPLTS
ncbi:protein kinase, putative [Bodo saltans]|uniref:Protein kinase, putative n=1 Tax=Bodo saltans TaxID=75058 RepID=A0A0S4KLA8_BODSA|nr:protein kinase, putative [Bodo saltans]|eukprot:CUI14411.1 protein kinase, putative [Bodo saltans]